ncbi:fatty acid synthase-like protein beta subunit [Lojkania enalia]|uniref:Fatty acid synthase-like protein beta subunit n=1 Tax=Lojkania enalia TaxID=147567 RepID=A0A9P4MYB0_9PLEO|nr:fatty acid synthase-like protein beta subunit [Didymosphaeria enalia]
MRQNYDMLSSQSTPAEKTQVAAVFGGQGDGNLTSLEELRCLYHYSHTSIDALIERATGTLEQLLHQSSSDSFHDTANFDLRGWINNKQASPTPEAFAEAHFSVPINTVLAFAQVIIVCKSYDLTPGEFAASLCSVSGRSEGMLLAMALAQTSDWPSFYSLADAYIELSFWIGLSVHEARPRATVTLGQVQECLDMAESKPSNALRVYGLPRATIETAIRLENKTASCNEHDHIHLASLDSYRQFTIAGPTDALIGVCTRLHKEKSSLAKRQQGLRLHFLPISTPLNTPIMAPVLGRLLSVASTMPMLNQELRIPIVLPQDGVVIQDGSTTALKVLYSVLESLLIRCMDWPAACEALGAHRVLAFGPVQTAAWIRETTAGVGLDVMDLADDAVLRHLKDHQHSLHTMPSKSSWQETFGPRIVRDSAGYYSLRTNMTARFNVPPLMVAGMTPTTVPWDVVAAIANAGYHAELAGGGYHRPDAFELAVRRLAAAVPARRGVTCNILYVNPKVTGSQIDVLKKLTQEGLPIRGITIGAGVPSPDVIKEWTASLELDHISFKPGSPSAIDQVIELAKIYPDLTIGLQWTGGRAGGHHSMEEFEPPILESYSRIRECENIVLIAGSGFGAAESSIAYLTGQWSCAFGRPPMPFDGILLGSRVMVAKEAHTALQAKSLICQTPGVDACDWRTSLDKGAGGVITIHSEFGYLIHVLATRGALLWKAFDDRIFCIRDVKKRLLYLRKHRDWILAALNSDYVRPWLAVDTRGNNVEMEEMKYSEMVRRLCLLMSTTSRREWIDPSYCRLVMEFIQEVGSRLSISVEGLSSDPATLPGKFEAAFGPLAATSIYPEDCMILMALFQRQGVKPVPFIPCLDQDFEKWFKKDTLWQSENIDSVFDGDIQRVLVIHGPVAARFSTIVDEPVKTIMDRICDDYVKILKQDGYQPNTDSSTQLLQPRLDMQIGQEVHGFPNGRMTRFTYLPGRAVPEIDFLIEALARSPQVGLILRSQWSISGGRVLENPLKAAIQPRSGDILEVVLNNKNEFQGFTFTQHTHEHAKMGSSSLSLRLQGPSGFVIQLVVPKCATNEVRSTYFQFEMRETAGSVEICENTFNRIASIRNLYRSLWFDKHPSLRQRDAGLRARYYSAEQTITRASVESFANMECSSPTELRDWSPRGSTVPLDMCAVIAWQSLLEPLTHPDLDCDFLQLLHRSVAFRYKAKTSPLRVGQTVAIESQITRREWRATGQNIEVTALIKRGHKQVVVVKSDFFIRASSSNQGSGKSFAVVHEPDMIVAVDNETLEAIIKDKKWLQLQEPQLVLLHQKLVFRTTSHTEYVGNGGPKNLQVKGRVYVEDSSGARKQVGLVHFDEHACRENPVMDFLRRRGAPQRTREELSLPGWSSGASIEVSMPSDSTTYARVSGDENPIHVSDVFARWAGLPSKIVHGMHTSVIARRFVEWAIGDKCRTRLRQWRATFHGMVFHGSRLKMQFQHTMMTDGEMLLHVEVCSADDGTRVMSAEAIVEQLSTAYIFTGQGSQRPGMGIEAYAAHSEVKAIWDRAEAYLQRQFGFSLLKIVRENPQTLTIHFGGQRGRRIRQNYLTMLSELRDPTLLSNTLHPHSPSYTFHKAQGLLYSTQFAQPALVVMEMAQFAHLQARGMVQSDARFAGHSLGEYAALGSFTTFMGFEALLELVWLRAFTMQNALGGDGDGETRFSMVAVDPGRIGKSFGETHLQDLVQCIQEGAQSFVEIVNYNVSGRQYVCAGHIKALSILTSVTNELATHRAPQSLSPIALNAIIARAVSSFPSSSPLTSSDLKNGTATIPLPGIDIPFHSRLLHSHIDDYRRYLERKIRVEDVRPEQLVGRWVPNVLGKPFGIGRGDVEEIRKVVGSRQLAGLIGEGLC